HPFGRPVVVALGAVHEPRRPDVAADPRVAARVDRDAVVAAGQQVAAGSVLLEAVDRRVDVLVHAGAAELPVARRISLEVRKAHREAVVAAEPDHAVVAVVLDAVDVADLLPAALLVRDDAGAAEDVVVDDGDAAARERDAVGVAALVDGRVGAGA